MADAILEVIERGGRHAWVEVVELCAKARSGEGGAVTGTPPNAVRPLAHSEK